MVSDTPNSAAPLVSRRRCFWRFRKRQGLYLLLIGLVALGVVYGLQLWQYYRTHVSTDDAYVVGDIISLSVQVQGTVAAVQVEDHQLVKVNQLLAQLDTRDFEIRVKQAEAAVAIATAGLRRAEFDLSMTQESTTSDADRTNAVLRAARSSFQESQHAAEETMARLHTAEAIVATAQAEVEVVNAQLDIARREVARLQALLADGIIAQQQFDVAESTLQAARAQQRARQRDLQRSQAEVERVRADLRSHRQAIERARAGIAEAQALSASSQAQRQHVDIKQAEIETAQALLQQAQANLDFAMLQLSYTVLRAPVAGVIAQKRLEVGQVVQPGRPVLAIVPLHNVWVEANFKETQLRHMRPGHKAILHIDAFPDQTLHGEVESISPGTGAVFSLLPPENATGNFVKIVQRVPVKIRVEILPSLQGVLRPGMSAVATVVVH